jgi:hypothetical protein
VKNVPILCAVAVAIGLTVYAIRGWPTELGSANHHTVIASATLDFPPSLDARRTLGVRELTKSDLLTLMQKRRPLSQMEKTQIDRGCLGLTCLYQGLGLMRWPELAQGTRAYLRLEDALGRTCSNGRQNFVFVKQAWWTSGKSPAPDPKGGEVPLSSVTRVKPGWYTFNYAVYFPATRTYAWINHREYGFPANLLWPMKAYLSLSPPPRDDNRPAQLYCSTCK